MHTPQYADATQMVMRYGCRYFCSFSSFLIFCLLAVVVWWWLMVSMYCMKRTIEWKKCCLNAINTFCERGNRKFSICILLSRPIFSSFFTSFLVISFPTKKKNLNGFYSYNVVFQCGVCFILLFFPKIGSFFIFVQSRVLNTIDAYCTFWCTVFLFFAFCFFFTHFRVSCVDFQITSNKNNILKLDKEFSRCLVFVRFTFSFERCYYE